jgi:hypothetical protein
MATITQFLKREVSTDAVAITCTQALCFVTSVFILALGSWKLSTLDLVGHQIFCGVASDRCRLASLSCLGPLVAHCTRCCEKREQITASPQAVVATNTFNTYTGGG